MSRPIPSLSLSDGLPESASAVPSTTSRSRRQLTLVSNAGFVACFDSLAALTAILVVFVSVNFAELPSNAQGFLSARVTVKNILQLTALAIAWPAVFHLFGLYEAQRVRQFGSEARRLLAAATAASVVALVFPFTSVSRSITLWDVPLFWLAAIVLGLTVRGGRQAVEHAHRRQARRTLIVGTGRLASLTFRDIRVDPRHRYDVVGFVDEPYHGRTGHERGLEPVIGTIAQLEQILMRQAIDEVVIALPVKSCYHHIQRVIELCERAGVQAKYGADMFESTVAFPRYHAHGDRAFVAMQVVPDAHWLAVKRAVDIVGALAGLVLFAPLMLVVAALIKLTSSGPILYAQDRCGLNRRAFRMHKFRSMYADADRLQASLEQRNEAVGPVFKIRNDPRVTPLGRILRKTSIDELPQLWNVLVGDMSLVGPRPLPWRDVDRITRPADMRRFSMRPGLTCLWQIQGRSNIGFERWVELDLEYIDNWSLGLDASILIKTVPAVITGVGAT
ncbi:MAG TPA: sugar transferase [Vicinamibacterales bacterium]|nr:sugar transferase [Vicinamibacterales bacterium]